MSNNRLMISCYRGLAPVSFPSEWTEGMDMEHAFAYEGGRAQIYFNTVNRGFEVWVDYPSADTLEDAFRPSPEGRVRELSSDEIASIQWGEFCEPWESYQTARLFGHGAILRIGE